MLAYAVAGGPVPPITPSYRPRLRCYRRVRVVASMLNSVDLFTGIGGFTLALSGYCRPMLYCDNNPHVLSALGRMMSRKMLPMAPVVTDVKKLDDIKAIVKGRQVHVLDPVVKLRQAYGAQGRTGSAAQTRLRPPRCPSVEKGCAPSSPARVWTAGRSCGSSAALPPCLPVSSNAYAPQPRSSSAPDLVLMRFFTKLSMAFHGRVACALQRHRPLSGRLMSSGAAA